MTQKLNNPVPLFLDARGNLLDGGRIYVGIANGDPQAQPIDLFWNSAKTIPAQQPLRTIGGRIVNGAQPASVFMGEADYSMRVADSQGAQIDYSPSVFVDTSAFQAHSAALDKVAAAAPTTFGTSLLALNNAAALAAATGLPTNPLAKTGGLMTGDITRQGAGTYLYHVNPAYASGKVYGPEYATDPTTQPGDIWLKPNG